MDRSLHISSPTYHYVFTSMFHNNMLRAKDLDTILGFSLKSGIVPKLFPKDSRSQIPVKLAIHTFSMILAWVITRKVLTNEEHRLRLVYAFGVTAIVILIKTRLV